MRCRRHCCGYGRTAAFCCQAGYRIAAHTPDPLPRQSHVHWAQRTSMSSIFTVSWWRHGLQISSGRNHVFRIYANGYIKVSPWCVEFSSDVRIRMPSLPVIFTELGIPLCHGKIHSFLVVPSRAPDLKWNLRQIFDADPTTVTRKDTMLKSQTHDRSFNFKRQFETTNSYFSGCINPVSDSLSALILEPTRGSGSAIVLDLISISLPGWNAFG